MKKKLQIIKTLHGWFACDDDSDLETFMVAMQAVMNHYFITWKFKFEIDGAEDFDNAQQYFEYEVNTMAMSNSLEAFQELCEKCMDFNFVGRISHPQLIY